MLVLTCRESQKLVRHYLKKQKKKTLLLKRVKIEKL